MQKIALIIMSLNDAITNFLHWIQSILGGKKPEVYEPPPTFGKETTISRWQAGEFLCSGVLPNHVRVQHFYVLTCNQVQRLRNKTPAEYRWEQENAVSMVPTHCFQLGYCPPVIIDGQARLGRPVVVFRIERNCYKRKKGAIVASADWIAAMKVAPALRDRIIDICNTPATETRYQLKGKPLKEGEKLGEKKAQPMQKIEVMNPRLELYSPEAYRTWEKFIDSLLSQENDKKPG